MASLETSHQRLQAAACFLAPFAMLSSTLGSLSFLAFATLQGCRAASLSSLYEEEPGRICKAAPGSVDWPTAQTWANFNQTVGGRLIKAVPPAAVCHPEQPNYDAEACEVVRAEWKSYTFHMTDPTSIAWNQYSNDSCLPWSDTPCDPAGYPAYSVNATCTEEVRQTILFAGQHNIRLVVKSSGHDHPGRSIAPGAITLWVHYMQGVETHESFRPTGCNFTIDEPAVTSPGGTQMGLLYETLDAMGRTIVGGANVTVSVGGHVTGGGHSVLSPKYGLAADQVLQMEVVTPQGDVVIANECQNTDLFWGMRGGGGSTFGVMTSVTVFTHPSPPLTGITLALAAPTVGTDWYWDMVGYVLSQYPGLDEAGLAGYTYVWSNSSVPGTPAAAAADALVAQFALLDTTDPADVLALWAPILAHVAATWPQTLQTVDARAYPSVYPWILTAADGLYPGSDAWVGSHLLDAPSLADPEAVARAWRRFTPQNNGGAAFMVAGNGTRNARPRGGGNAVNPSWRRTSIDATNGLYFEPMNPAAREEALVALNEHVQGVRDLAPDMGAYVNENNHGEPDWQRSFWGDNYERLLSIKRAVDPNDVLWCNPCVGNERWAERGYRLCRIDDDVPGEEDACVDK